MKLEDQVVSLPLAKRLKELGVKQESYFFWISSGKKGTGESIDPWKCKANNQWTDSYVKDGTAISAFSVAELGEMLPKFFERTYYHWIITSKANGIWRIRFNPDNGIDVEQAETEADARAKMLIYLIEKGVVKP